MAPKGMIETDEEPIAPALREVEEETGLKPPPISRPLTALRQSGGKRVLCWAAEGDLDLAAFSPGEFQMEWPPRSGKQPTYPELDVVAYFEASEALRRILPSQAPLIREVLGLLEGDI